MIFNFNSITLSFLVVASVTLAVVVVLVWYVYSSRKFRQDIIDLMDEKLEDYLKEQRRHWWEETQEEPQIPKDETEFAEPQAEQKETAEEQQEVAEGLPGAEESKQEDDKNVM